ncbi:bifunctional phosphopantothenoylcysteine decarboxylase/phosphopantothenate--cysteine ligase CoaBC, partial [Candidatus Dependentiae bacterium]|nr:bifunctional phosphopantothenoylcysteine decarboxylase/phosphopantothenate--cysteine ligase CoaBC [Candidatus Dependentiae bacterium]
MSGRIIIGVTGSIAAFKSLELVRMLVKNGKEIDVILTEAGERFIPKVNFKSFTSGTVASDLWSEEVNQPIHIKLSKAASILVVVPASADFIAKAAAGIADNLLLSTFLAFNGPKIIAPAMNPNMYKNPITLRNIRTLRKFGVDFIEPTTGYMADYLIGVGHLADLQDIFDYIEKYERKQVLKGKKVLITAGGTREFLDPVRFIGNPSTGTMGIELAREFWKFGAEVKLISANISKQIPSYIKNIEVINSEEMLKVVRKNFKASDIFVSTAAISDFTPRTPKKVKIKKSTDLKEIKLKRTIDIIKEISKHKGKKKIIGFAA